MGRGGGTRLGVPFFVFGEERFNTEGTEEENRGRGERGAGLKDQRYREECGEKREERPASEGRPY